MHWYAHPKFQGPLATVKDVLVQLPLESGVGPSSTDAEPDGGDVAGAEVEDAGAVVEDALPGPEVVVDDATADIEVVLVELGAEPLGTGSVYEGVFGVEAPPGPPELPITMPIRAAATPTMTKCHVRHERRSLILSEPRAGGPACGGRCGAGPHDDP